jgi:hypothetical protein
MPKIDRPIVQLTPAQEQWIESFNFLTSDSISALNLTYLLWGRITWPEFMALEIESWRNWQNTVMKRLENLWEEKHVD